MPTDSQYLHGTAPTEQARLTRLNGLLNDAALRELNLTPGTRVLDVASGLGQLSRAMARAVGPTGRVVGIERSPEQIREANRQAAEAGEAGLAEFRLGDAMSLPLRGGEWGQFDLAHTRFLLEHVPDPLAVVKGMVAAVRPGGRIVLQDDSHDIMRLCPEPAGFSHLWRQYIRTYDRVGNDPHVGHRLVSLLVQAGARPTRNTWLFFGACAGQVEDFPLYVDNLIHIIDGVRAEILALGEWGERDLDSALEAMRQWKLRPDGALWYAVSWAEAQK